MPQGPALQPGQDPAAAGNMMEGKGPQQGQDPVIEALKTIQVAIAALTEKGDPKAQAITDAFKGLLEAFQGVGEKEGETQGQPEVGEPAGKPIPPPMRGSKPMVENQTRGAVPAL